jgi:hypothetical protein
MEYIYILSCQRGQGSPEIHSMWNSYEKAIKSYYHYHISDKSTSSISNFMFLYKFPTNTIFSVGGEGESWRDWSDVKIQKSSKYRIKFDSFKELESEYKVFNRDDKLTELGI